MTPQVLIVDDQPLWQELLTAILANDGIAVSSAQSYDHALSLIAEQMYHVIVVDLRLEGDDASHADGMHLLKYLAATKRTLPVPIVLTGYPTTERVRESFKSYRVWDFLLKLEFDETSFLQTIRDALVFARNTDMSLPLNTAWTKLRTAAASEVTNRLQPGMFLLAVDELLATITNALGLAESTETCDLINDLVLGQIDAGEVFHELRMQSPLPVIVIPTSEEASISIDRLRDVLQAKFRQPVNVALLIAVEDRLSPNLLRVVDTLRSVYGIDLVILQRSDILGVAADRDQYAAFRSLILSQVNLLSVSPFETVGPVADAMFFGREVELRYIIEQANTSSFAVVGGRRIGKTSLLNRLHRIRLPAAGFSAIYFDCSTVSSEEAFLGAPLRDVRAADGAFLPGEMGELLRSCPAAARVVLLLDEADRLVQIDGASSWQILSSLRALSNTGQLQVILSGERRLRTALHDPTSPLFNFVSELVLGRLDFDATEQLVTRPMSRLGIELSDESQVVQRIYEVTSGHPNIVQRLCHRLIAGLQERDGRSLTIEDVEVVVNDVHFQEVDFLETCWQSASPLEKIVSIVLAEADGPLGVADVRRSVGARVGVDPGVRATKAALDALVDFRSLLGRTRDKYGFALQAFPLVFANAVTSPDLFEVFAEQLRAEGISE